MTDETLSRTIENTDDAYVMDFGLVTLPSGVALNVTGAWDGILHLEVELTSGVVHRHQCREFFVGTGGSKLNHFLVSLDRPWTGGTIISRPFRLFQPYFYTRDDVTSLVDGSVFNQSRGLIKVLPAGFARYAAWTDYRGQAVGPISAFSRWKHFQIPAPSKTPTVASQIATSWSTTQEAPGTFTYRYTYVWGKKHLRQQSPGGSYDPMWESAPSPESAAISATTASVLVSGMTNIDWQLNFDPDPTTDRNGRSGMRKRIYRARTAVASNGTTEQNVESPGIYFFLAEVEGNVTTYTDDGTAIPEYHRRLPESHGHWAWACHPHQDNDYEVDLRVYRRPLALQVDSDAPQVHPDFEDMLLLLVLKGLAEIDKQPADAENYEKQYEKRVNAWRGREANPADYVPAVPWTPNLSVAPLTYGTPTS